jgi:hypothetical protein
MLAREHDLPCPDHLGKRLVTRLTGGALKTGARLDLYVHDAQGHAQAVAHRLTMTWPRVGGSLQAMVDMNGAERREVFGVGEEVEQDSGIKTAGESDMQGGGVAPGGQGVP